MKQMHACCTLLCASVHWGVKAKSFDISAQCDSSSLFPFPQTCKPPPPLPPPLLLRTSVATWRPRPYQNMHSVTYTTNPFTFWAKIPQLQQPADLSLEPNRPSVLHKSKVAAGNLQASSQRAWKTLLISPTTHLYFQREDSYAHIKAIEEYDKRQVIAINLLRALFC